MEERDLLFKPVINSDPRVLTSSQIDSYNENGYIMPIDIYDSNEATCNREYFDMLLRKMSELKDGRDTYAINGYHTRCRGIWDIVTNPRILNYVEDLMGPNVVAWGTHFFCKQPLDPKHVPWHQDASYWPFTPARTVTVWLAIDDADSDNAAMQFIPGTHKLGPLDWKETNRPAVLNQEIANIDSLGDPVWDELRAGQISLHADMLAHGSTSNPSNRRRCGLTIRYCPPDVTSLDKSWSSQSVICRGEDSTRTWANTPRPDGEDLSLLNKPKSIGAN